MLVMPSKQVNLRMIQISKSTFLKYCSKVHPDWPERRVSRVLEARTGENPYTGKKHKGVVLTDNLDDSVDRIIAFCKENGFSYRVLKDTVEAII